MLGVTLGGLRKLLPVGLLALAACGSPSGGSGGAAAPDSGNVTSGTGGSTGQGTGGSTATGGSTGTAMDAGDQTQPGTGGTTTGGGTDASVAADTGNAIPWEQQYPREKRRMMLRDEGKNILHYVNFGNPAENWQASTTGASRGMQLIGNGRLLGGQHDGYEEYDLKTGMSLHRYMGTTTQAAYRLANGDTMLSTMGGDVSLVILEAKTDVVKKTIHYAGYNYTRLPRPTPQGTFLVPCDTQLFEGDDTGKVLWKTTAPGWAHIWKAVQLPGGKVVVGTSFGSSLDILDTNHMVIQRIGTKQMPDAATIKPNFFSEFQVLPNGNFITPNWQGHGGGNGASGVQVLEFDPTGKLVWSYKQDAAVYSSIQAVLVLDGLDPQYLHTEAVTGQWTPVK